MIARAFVLINSELGAEAAVLEALGSIPEVSEVHVIYVVYYISALVEAKTGQELKEIISLRIGRLEASDRR